MPNDLEQHFYANNQRLISKWLHYFPIYEQHFSPYRHKPTTVVEVGVFHGGSMQMWKEYFGSSARIVGIDIDPRTQIFADEQVEIVVGDQGDRTFLQSLRERLGSVDVFIDDGGHTMEQQLATFQELWPTVVEGGVYLIEDLHTSYWPEYGGGNGNLSFIEFAKALIDSMNAWHSRGAHEIDSYTRSIRGMHVYDSIIVFDKGVVSEPKNRMTGNPVFELTEGQQDTFRKSIDMPEPAMKISPLEDDVNPNRPLPRVSRWLPNRRRGS